MLRKSEIFILVNIDNMILRIIVEQIVQRWNAEPICVPVVGRFEWQKLNKFVRTML